MISALTLMVALVSQASAGEWSDDKKLVLGDLCLSEHAPKVSDNGELQVRFCACFIEEVSAAAPPESLSTPEAPAMLNEADRACRAQARPGVARADAEADDPLRVEAEVVAEGGAEGLHTKLGLKTPGLKIDPLFVAEHQRGAKPAADAAHAEA